MPDKNILNAEPVEELLKEDGNLIKIQIDRNDFGRFKSRIWGQHTATGKVVKIADAFDGVREQSPGVGDIVCCLVSDAEALHDTKANSSHCASTNQKHHRPSVDIERHPGF